MPEPGRTAAPGSLPGSPPLKDTQTMNTEYPAETEGKSRRRQIIADIALLSVTMIWGGTFVMVQDAVSEFPVHRFLTIRFALAALVLIPFVAMRLESARKKEVGAGVLIGLFLFAGYAFQTTGQ